MNAPKRRFVVYENPETSEVSGEFDALYEALGHPAKPQAQIIQNGVVMANCKDGRWDLTSAGLEIEFQRYAQGRWVLDFPKEAGTYSVADRCGHFAGQRSLVYVKGELIDTRNIQTQAGSEWRGYWWSEPIPDMPTAPDIAKV